MDARPRGSATTAAALLLAVALLFSAPASVLAAPAPGSVDAKKAEKAAAEADVARMTADLQAQTQEYAQLGRRIEAARAEISRVESETGNLDRAITERRQLLRERAVELYRAEPMGMFALLLGSHSPRDFLLRLDYLTQVSQSDASLVEETTRLYSQNLYLESVLNQRMKGLVELLSSADDQQAKLEKAISDAQTKSKQLDVDIANMLAAQTTTGSAPVGAFTADTVISEANFRAPHALDAAGIQAFLDGLPGPLKSYSGPDHTGRTATAAQMIAEASIAYNVSPKVILVTLQKEQSLLEKTPKSQEGWDWAMGAGKTDSKTYYEYKGFGMQIWIGAQKLDKNALDWRPGATEEVDGSLVHPTNSGTFAQYRYTPHFSGVMSFWTLYWRYFGDPLAGGL